VERRYFQIFRSGNLIVGIIPLNQSIYHETFKTREEAKTNIFDYIEIFYNRQRSHSTLNYLSPHDYEKQIINF